jgi:hypothetical protein
MMAMITFLLGMMILIGNGATAGTGLDHRRSVQQTKAGAIRIVGGTPASENLSFGFSAGSKLCGGTLIHSDMFLTAARK